MHRVLKCLYRVRQVIQYLVLLVKPRVDLQLQLLPQLPKLVHRQYLKLLHLLLLLLQLIVHLIPKPPKLQTLISPLIVYLLLQLVILIVQSLQYLLFPLNASLTLLIILRLQLTKSIANDIYLLITLYYSILYLFFQCVLYF